jgi:hypothetical protein
MGPAQGGRLSLLRNLGKPLLSACQILVNDKALQGGIHILAPNSLTDLHMLPFANDRLLPNTKETNDRISNTTASAPFAKIASVDESAV